MLNVRGAVRVMFIVCSIIMVFGIPFGLAILGTLPAQTQGATDDFYRIAWACIVGGLCGLMILIDLLIVEPWNFRRANRRLHL